jgi:hypothetical protein
LSWSPPPLPSLSPPSRPLPLLLLLGLPSSTPSVRTVFLWCYYSVRRVLLCCYDSVSIVLGQCYYIVDLASVQRKYNVISTLYMQVFYICYHCLSSGTAQHHHCCLAHCPALAAAQYHHSHWVPHWVGLVAPVGRESAYAPRRGPPTVM